MPSERQVTRTIDGKGRTIRELLSAKRYSIDYYQREYKWEAKQIRELIEDLTNKFLQSYEAADERSDVESYARYFLGSIIISDKEGEKFIIDGQQRLTSLTLLLIYLYHHIKDADDKKQVADLVFSQKYGKKSFNLSVSERTACMEALLAGKPLEERKHPESVANILDRYHDIEEQFAQLPEELHGNALPHFTDWLIENVQFVEITAYSDDDAYTIFETMNDRGLSLTPTDMLKGYLLANISDMDRRDRANREWKRCVGYLQEIGREEDADAIKSWLRSQYAETIRERKAGAVPLDFDLIGTEFHRWVRDNEKKLGLVGGTEFAKFIEHDFSFYAHWYDQIRHAAENLTSGLECVFYNAQFNFTLQYPLLLSPLRTEDSDAEIRRKLKVTSTYLEILIARRIWNFRAIDYSTMQYAMFLVMKEIRHKSPPKLVDILTKRLDQGAESFSANSRFYLHGGNGRQIRKVLARITDFVETESGMGSHYTEYIRRGGKKGYEIEHIWANHPDQHKDEFSHPNEFEEYRNRIGGLLLLPKSFNASYGDLTFKEKLPHYNSQNLLARSLHEKAYEHNPGFLRFIKTSSLPFHAYAQFKKADQDERHDLYRRLAEEIWNPNRLGGALGT